MKTVKISYKWKAFAAVAIATFTGIIDFSFVNMSLPLMTKTFNTGLATVMWINLIYYVILVSIAPVLGKISDLFGFKKVFVTGSAINIIGLIACSFSQTIWQLILFRIVHAVGNAMLQTCFSAIITDAFPSEERGRGLGMSNAAFSLGFIVGPIIGGMLLEWFDWRSIFYVRVPVWIVVFIMGISLLRSSKPKNIKIKIDFPGIITSFTGLFTLILGIGLIPRMGLKSPVIYALIVTGIIILGIFILVEKKAEDPIVNLSLFKNKIFTGGIISMLLYWTSVLGYGLTTPFFFIDGLNISPSYLGLLMCIGSITSFIVSPISGSLSDRFNSVSVCITGAIIFLASLFLMYNYNLQIGISFIIFTSIIGGIASGTFQPSNSSIIMGSVHPDQRGFASALMASIIGLSTSVGMAWSGTVFSLRKTFHEGELIRQGVKDLVSNQSVSLAFNNTVFVSICIAFFVLISTIIPRITKAKNNQTMS
jgi:EmrB/QacA subfamily drug resistance transporter